MTRLESLKRGDLVRGRTGRVYVVTGNYGRRITAVETVDICNSIEWDVVSPTGAQECGRLWSQMNEHLKAPRQQKFNLSVCIDTVE